jgi:hypothetical protein
MPYHATQGVGEVNGMAERLASAGTYGPDGRLDIIASLSPPEKALPKWRFKNWA